MKHVFNKRFYARMIVTAGRNQSRVIDEGSGLLGKSKWEMMRK